MFDTDSIISYHDKPKSSIVEFSRNFGENSDDYKDFLPSARDLGDETYDCE